MSRTTPGPTKHATPSRSILKATSVLGKRPKDDAELTFEDLPTSPTKRRKVLFDEVRNRTYEVGNRTMDEVKREVRDALEEHRRGNDGSYDTLKELFANNSRSHKPTLSDGGDDLKPQELRAYVVALTSCMPLLKDRECNGLVKAIIKCRWLGRDDDFVKVYNYFLASLISAQGSFLSPVLTMMVENFTLTRPSHWAVPDYPEVSRDVMRDRLHKSIRHLLQIFPAATDVLETLLGSKFPFPDQSAKDHMAYIHNILRIKDYAPALTDDILEVILARVVNIDSRMMVDLEDLDDDITAAVMYAIRDNPTDPANWEDRDDDDDSDTESIDSDDPDYDQEAAKIKEVKDNVEKMDAILDTLFEYHNSLIAPDPGSEKAFDAFTAILREFKDWVLPTYKSRHTQFLIFHFAQMDERLSDAFCGEMIYLSFNQHTPDILRQSAIAYLASYVARGAHVQRESVQSIFDLIIHHMNEYSEKKEASCLGPDLRRWWIFYSLAQAAMYIFCFRWQDLVVWAPEWVDRQDPASYLGQDLEWPGTNKQDFMSHIRGKFNPLKVCAPVIVEEFAKLAHRLQFAYVYPLIETNKRLRLTQFMTSYATGNALRDAGYEAGDESLHVMDPYFPFDPYQLPLSKRWLENDYVQWRGVPGLNADESEDDSDEMEEDDEVDDLAEATGTESDGPDE